VCGIAGVSHFDASPADPRLLRRMLGHLHHRGPDERGVYLDGGVGLGHTRLSILDLAGGRQPMSNEDGNLWVTFNGEIFNYLELRTWLVQKGHVFATRSDTEVILHLYEEYGDRCVEHFNGQWALAIWDARRQRLFLSRDRLGVRPLYYTTTAGKLLFASEVKALLADPDVSRQIDFRGLHQVFTYWATLPPRTVFQGISELPPAHNLIAENGTVRLERYWELDYTDGDAAQTEAECAECLLELLTDAVRLRLRADVPVGAYLSGGLDSALTAALVKQSNTASLRTFSVGFDDPEFDETVYQQEVVQALQTEHQSLRCSYADIGRVFPEVVWHAEQPLLRTAPAPMFLLSKLVRDAGYKVVVTGEGADELLGGYDIFKEAKVRRFWARKPESAVRAALLERLYPYLPAMRSQSLAYLKAFFHARPTDLANPFFSHLPRWDLTAGLRRFLAPEVGAALVDHQRDADCLPLLPEGFGRWRPFCQAQWLETAVLLPGYILSSQGDRVAMAHAVEGRHPFLDHRVVEFAARIRPRWKMKGLDEKHLVKRAAGNLVPAAILKRSKQPYRAPEAKSFLGSASQPTRHDYVEELLSPHCVRRFGLFDPQAVEHLVGKIRAGRAIGIKDNMAFVGVLSSQLVVDQFIECFAGRSAEGALCSSISE
jgi:asparagine synthase (glutamine-hydrolysing)